MTSVADPPSLTTSDAARMGAELFGIRGGATPLPSERDQNFRLIADDGSRWVLKVANQAESAEMITAENGVIRHLAATGLTPTLAAMLEPSSASTDAKIEPVDDSTVRVDGHFVRVISHLRGVPYGRARLRSPGLRRSLGAAVATISQSLADFDHPALHRDFAWDLDGARQRVDADLSLIASPVIRESIAALIAGYADTVGPRLAGLRRSVIHNDANDFNVLVDPRAQVVTGIIDFGDMVHSHLVNDVAVAIAYATLGTTDPLEAACDVLGGFHAVQPLTDDEIACVFHLMCLRLSLSACMAAHQQAANPDNEYLGISQGPIAEMLPRLAAIHPRWAHYKLRAACGLPAVPDSSRVVNWIEANASSLARVTDFDLSGPEATHIDMSVGSPLISGEPSENLEPMLSRRVDDFLARAGATVGYGGYGEPRTVYSFDEFAGDDPYEERRTIHSAIDISAPAGTALYAPLNGVIHGFENATALGDYGPVVALRHEVTDEVGPLTFFTVYGHLSMESLPTWTIGKRIAAGEHFADLGVAPTNGNWWPHTHVQLVIDLLDVAVNVDGACRPTDRDAWLSNCPDPCTLLGITARSMRASSTERLVERRAERTGANVSISYGDQPLHIRRGWKQYLFDANGRRYIDGYNNVAHVGHAHPRVARRVAEQLGVLNTNTRYLQDQLLDYADDLTATLPAELSVCFFTASGSEANELALRLARAHTGGRELLVMDSAYHGHTTTLINISPYKHDGPGGQGAPKWVHTTPIPDVYRGAHRATHPDPGAAYAADVQLEIDRLLADGRTITGYIAETCPSVGGQIMLPTGFLAATYAAVRGAGGLCIADEVQTGFGRLGTHFWAFEAHGVTPDIVVLGKPIANGYPMGAVVTTPEIAASFANGMEYFSTFGGSTAACVAAHETLRVVHDEGIQAHALDVGDHLLAGLNALKLSHELIGDVRGSGLFLGVELVLDRETLEPAAEQANWIVRRMRQLGVLVGTDGPLHNVIKLRGPMPLQRSDADRILATLTQALTEVWRNA